MDLIQRRRLKKLTQAVYSQAASQRGDEPVEHRIRVLPSVPAVIVLVVVILVVAGVSAWRFHSAQLASTRLIDAPPDTLSTPQSAQSAEPPSDMTTINEGDPSTPSESVTITVYVTGQVGQPQVVELPSGSRVIDAVNAAGGPLADADLESLNMARVLIDGEHIAVTRPGEDPPPGAQAGPAPEGGPGHSPAGTSAACININSAEAAELENLDGVGPAIAQRIIDYRQNVGRFESVEQLDDVSGIGPAMLEKISAGACV